MNNNPQQQNQNPWSENPETEDVIINNFIPKKKKKKKKSFLAYPENKTNIRLSTRSTLDHANQNKHKRI